MIIFLLLGFFVAIAISIIIDQKNKKKLIAPKSYLSSLRNKPKSPSFKF